MLGLGGTSMSDGTNYQLFRMFSSLSHYTFLLGSNRPGSRPLSLRNPCKPGTQTLKLQILKVNERGGANGLCLPPYGLPAGIQDYILPKHQPVKGDFRFFRLFLSQGGFTGLQSRGEIRSQWYNLMML